MAYPETTWLSSNFILIVIQLRENKLGQIRLNGDMSEPFPITNDVKQDCVLAPTLFCISLVMMLKQITDDLGDEDGVYVGTLMMAAFLIYFSSKPTPRPWRGGSGTFSLQMTLPSLPTQSMPCCASYYALRTPRVCMLMTHAS